MNDGVEVAAVEEEGAFRLKPPETGALNGAVKVVGWVAVLVDVVEG